MPIIRSLKSGKAYPLSVHTNNEGNLELRFAGVGSDFRALIDDIKSLEGARWNPDRKVWQCKHPHLSSRNRFVLGFLTDLSDTFETVLRLPYSRYFPDPKPDYQPNRKLYAHQLEMHNLMMYGKRVLIAAEMGTGKTLATIETIEKAVEQVPALNPHEAVWVIAPRSALESWKYELKKWGCPYSVKLIPNSPQSISRAMAEADLPPFVLILDEASAFKNSATKRWQLVYDLQLKMSNAYKNEEYVIALTGTPAPRDPTNWWGLTEIVRPGWLKEKNIHEFRKRLAYIEEEQGPHGKYSKVKGWRTDTVDQLPQRLAGVSQLVLKKHCLDLPAKVYSTIRIEPTEEIISSLDLLKEMYPQTLTFLTRARELADGFAVTAEDDGPTTSHFVGSPKYEILKEYLDNFRADDKNRIVIFAAFTDTIDKILHTCDEAGWNVIRVDGRGWMPWSTQHGDGRIDNLEASQEQFQDKDLDKPIAFVGNPIAGGRGLTLTASDTILYFSNSFDGEARMQSEDRIHRIGTKGANIVDFLYLPTDEYVLENLKLKKDLQAVSMGEIVDQIAKFKMEMKR